MAGERPTWWHEGGAKLQRTDKPIITPDKFTPSYGMSFESPAACLSVHTSLGSGSDWRINWIVKTYQGHVGYEAPRVKGSRDFSDLEVAEAFGLTNDFSSLEDSDAELVARYNATIARTGRFIRAGNYLNVPGPGTGLDGDANLSFYLTAGVKNTVRELFTAFIEGYNERIQQTEPKFYQPERKTLAAVAQLLQPRGPEWIPEPVAWI